MYIDESGIEDNARVTHGWSLKGQRCFGPKVYAHKRRVNMIAGLCDKKLVAPFVFEGNCNGVLFECYVKEVLIKTLRAGQTVVMDNINFHKTPQVKALIESVGCQLLFLPTYSPDLNPIEHWWFKIKNLIRKAVGRFNNFFNLVEFMILCVSTKVF